MGPEQGSLRPRNLEPQAVALAGADLRGDQHARRAVVEAQQDVAVVVERAARHHRAEIGAELGDLQV